MPEFHIASGKDCRAKMGGYCGEADDQYDLEGHQFPLQRWVTAHLPRILRLLLDAPLRRSSSSIARASRRVFGEHI